MCTHPFLRLVTYSGALWIPNPPKYSLIKLKVQPDEKSVPCPRYTEKKGNAKQECHSDDFINNSTPSPLETLLGDNFT